jgi:hypothetical protein
MYKPKVKPTRTFYMANSGGRYEIDADGKRQLVSKTKEKPRKVAVKSGSANAKKPTAKVTPHPLSVSGVRTADK